MLLRVLRLQVLLHVVAYGNSSSYVTIAQGSRLPGRITPRQTQPYGDHRVQLACHKLIRIVRSVGTTYWSPGFKTSGHSLFLEGFSFKCLFIVTEQKFRVELRVSFASCCYVQDNAKCVARISNRGTCCFFFLRNTHQQTYALRWVLALL